MRILLSLLMLGLAFEGVAVAQTETAPTTSSTEQAAPPPQSPISEDAAAVREIFAAFVYDTGAYEIYITNRIPGFQDETRHSPFYRQASRARREALDHVIDGLDQIVREEMDDELDVMAEEISARAVAIMPREDIQRVGAFIRDPRWAPLFRRLISEAAANDKKGVETELSPTEAEAAELREFLRTPEGRLLETHGGDLFQLIATEFRASGPRMSERIQARLTRDLCTAMAEQCPREFRNQQGI